MYVCIYCFTSNKGRFISNNVFTVFFIHTAVLCNISKFVRNLKFVSAFLYYDFVTNEGFTESSFFVLTSCKFVVSS